jgi:acylphosphatase
MKVRAHVVISGRVQGVFFRSNTKREAVKLGLTGFVRNLDDGSVEAVFEGEKSEVEKIIEFCKKGPSGSEVSSVDVQWEKFKAEFTEFDIEYF